MPAPTVAVTVNLTSMLGVAVAGATITAKLDKTDFYNGVVVASTTTAKSDVSGMAVLNLFPNALADASAPGLGTTGSSYKIAISSPGGKTVRVTAIIPNQACNLHEVIAESDVVAQPLGIANPVRYDLAQSLTTQQQAQARSNIGFDAAVRALALTGLSLVAATAITASDTVLSAAGKLQAQITANNTALTSGALRTTGYSAGSQNINFAGAASSYSNQWLYSRLYAFGTLATGAGPNSFNSIVAIDQANAQAVPFLSGLNVTYRAAAGAVGGRIAMHSDMGITGAVSAGTGTPDFVSNGSHAFASANAGGGGTIVTSPDDGYVGGLFGGNDHPRLASGGTYWRVLAGREIDVEIESGASAYARVGLFVVTGTNAASQAFGDDVGIALSNKSGATIPWKHGIKFGMTWGVWPFDASSTLIGAQKRIYPTGSPESVINAAYGIDFSSVTFATAAFKSPGFSVNGAGAIASTGVSVLNSGSGINWGGATVNSLSTSGFYVDSNHTGSASISGGADLNRIVINSDQVALTSTQAVNGLAIDHNFGGGSTKGSRQALQVYLVQTGATTNAANGIDSFYVGGAVYSIAQFSDGGTGASYTTGHGHVCGFNPVARLHGAATNYYELTGMEVNVSAHTGTSMGAKKGIQIVKDASDVVQGGHAIDTALMMADQAGAVGWNYGVTFGAPASQWPMASTSTLIAALGGNVRAVAMSAAHGVDFSKVKFSGSAIKSMGFSVDGGGAASVSALTAGSATLTATTTGAKLDVPYKVANAVAIAAGGTGYVVGDRIRTASGGVFEVSSVSAGAVTGVTALAWDVSAAPPANPIATTADYTGLFSTGGTGCTLNLTWPSFNRLMVVPGGTVYLATDGGATNGYSVVSNAPASGVSALVAIGADTNIHAVVQAKGTGAMAAYSSGPTAFYVDNPGFGNVFSVEQVGGSTVNANRIAVVAAIATGTPIVKAVGSDTNINLNLVSKNTGVVQANGVQVVDVSTAQSLSNKTLTASSLAGTTVAMTGAITSSGTGGIGYATGAGGTVAQATSKATGVTLNKTCGQITMNNAALAAGAKVSFVVTNSTVAATDFPDVVIASGGTANAYRANVTAVAAGSFTVTVENITAGSLSESPVITFAVVKTVTA